MTQYNPTRDFLILKGEHIAEKTDSGIIIPEIARKTLNEGVIIKKGPDTPEEFHEGDTVVFAPASEYKLKVDGEMLLVVQCENVILCKPAKAGPPKVTTSQLFPKPAAA